MSVDLTRDGAIYTITIDRPEALNALNTRVLSELDAVLDEIVADDDANVVIVTGVGDKAFVAGADIAEMRDMRPDEAHAFGRKGQAVFDRLASLPQPTIAAVNGVALAAAVSWPWRAICVSLRTTPRSANRRSGLGSSLGSRAPRGPLAWSDLRRRSR